MLNACHESVYSVLSQWLVLLKQPAQQQTIFFFMTLFTMPVLQTQLSCLVSGTGVRVLTFGLVGIFECSEMFV